MPISKYAGAAATIVWTLGWSLGAYRAAQNLIQPAVAPIVISLVTAALALVGCVMTARLIRPLPIPREEKKSEDTESTTKKIVGYLGVLVWCGVAIVWNLAIFGTLIRAASQKQLVIVLLMIPFSVIGWFLLNVLFVSIGLVLDSIFKPDETVKRWP